MGSKNPHRILSDRNRERDFLSGEVVKIKVIIGFCIFSVIDSKQERGFPCERDTVPKNASDDPSVPCIQDIRTREGKSKDRKRKAPSVIEGRPEDKGKPSSPARYRAGLKGNAISPSFRPAYRIHSTVQVPSGHGCLPVSGCSL